MERGGVVECVRGDDGRSSAYRLTEAGKELRQVLEAMSDWGERFQDVEASESDIHPMTTVCMLRARVRGEDLPERKVVVQIVTAPPKDSLSWLVLENGVASLCVDNPGFDVDLYVTTDVPTLYRIWLDQTSVAAAIECGQFKVEGDRALVRVFPSWFGPLKSELAEHFEALSAQLTPAGA
jgi:hypothetical protein